MLDIKFVRENKELVKQNIKNKFQNQKLLLVDEVCELDTKIRNYKQEVEALRQSRNELSKQIGMFMREGKVDEANKVKDTVSKNNARIAELEPELDKLQEELTKKMMIIPNIIDKSVPIGKDDSENVENQKYGDPVVPKYEIPYTNIGKTVRKLSFTVIFLRLRKISSAMAAIGISRWNHNDGLKGP